MFQAVNMTLIHLLPAYMDRDLRFTGSFVVVFTPGAGVFQIDDNLQKITESRMARIGFPTIDVISLTMPPLHHAPLYVILSKVEKQADGGMSDLSLDPTVQETTPPKFSKRLSVPKWIRLSFPFGAEESHYELAQSKAGRWWVFLLSSIVFDVPFFYLKKVQKTTNARGVFV